MIDALSLLNSVLICALVGDKNAKPPRVMHSAVNAIVAKWNFCIPLILLRCSFIIVLLTFCFVFFPHRRLDVESHDASIDERENIGEIGGANS